MSGGEARILKRTHVKDYVKQALNFVLYDHKSEEFQAFSYGFHLVASSALYHLVQPEDLKLCICGVPDIDWGEMQRKARYQPPYSEHHPLITALWDFVFPLDRADSQRLFCLWTGSEVVPEGGFELSVYD